MKYIMQMLYAPSFPVFSVAQLLSKWMNAHKMYIVMNLSH